MPDRDGAHAVERPVDRDGVLAADNAWNGKFQVVGNGGWAGAISVGAMQTALRAGYATASTDAGHKGVQGSAAFAVGHPEKGVDFAWRAIHETTVRLKALLGAYENRHGCPTSTAVRLVDVRG